LSANQRLACKPCRFAEFFAKIRQICCFFSGSCSITEVIEQLYCLIIGGKSYSEKEIGENIGVVLQEGDKGYDLQKKIKAIFTCHALGLGNSPLISGCIDSKGNGKRESGLPFYKCTLQLKKERMPIKNIWRSGGEGEYF
jgi:hypothetical protein